MSNYSNRSSFNETKPPPVIGIDLGTTHSAIACYRFGRIEVISDNYSKRIIPSFVYYDPENGEVSVGSNAWDSSEREPTNLLKDSKRFIGRKFKDESITKYTTNRSQWDYTLKEGPEEEAAFEIEISGRKILKKPEEVSADILKYLKTTAEYWLNTEVTEAVISIPAYFCNAQRKATITAAKLAGLKVLKLITEPVAGAIHYVKDRNVTSKLIVFDWGGGTLDVSFIQVNGKTFEVKGVYGDTFLGGRDIDEKLCEHFKVPVSKNAELFKRRLLSRCIKIKKKLSVTTMVDHELTCYDGRNNLPLKMTRTQFEKLTDDLFKRAMSIVEYAVEDMHWERESIDEVVLVGGTTKIPKIRRLLEQYFGAAKIKTDSNPDEAVACGACIQAAALRNLDDLEKYVVTEITPMSLGIKTQCDLMSVLIGRHSRLPISSTRDYRNLFNDQRSIGLIIYEGERKNVEFNNKLGEFAVDGLPDARAGDLEILITFNLDEDGVLTVTANIPSIAKIEKLTMILKEFRLNENRIARSIAEAKSMKHEDDLFERFGKYFSDSGIVCKRLLYDIEKITDDESKQFVKKQCQEYLKDCDKYKFTEMDLLEKRFTKFKEAVQEILLSFSMLEIKL